MTHYLDLSPCDYFPFDHSGHLLAIGWLDSAHEYETGKYGADDYEHLKKLFTDPFQPCVSMGLHTCNLCQFDGPKGTNNLFLPSDGDVLVAPELILHYISAHSYLPPARFTMAMRNTKDTRTMEYKKDLLKNNGSFLIQK